MWQGDRLGTVEVRLLALYAGMTAWLSKVARRLRTEEGQSMVEYAVVVALVAIIAMAAVQAFGNGIAQVFQQLLSKITSLGS